MATKVKKEKKQRRPDVKVASTKVEMRSLSDIVANSGQSRGMGVLSRMNDEGYGVFEKKEEGKEPIWPSLLSDKPEDRKFMINMLEDREPEFCERAESIHRDGQFQAIGVYETEDGLDVIYGMGRALGAAFNHAKYGNDDTEPQIECKVYEFEEQPTAGQLLEMALKENTLRSGESPIDQALTLRKMMKEENYTEADLALCFNFSKTNGSKVDQGASKIWVKNRLALLDPLIEDLRVKVHTGKMPIDTALKWLAHRKIHGKDSKPSDRDPSKQRFRLHSVASYIKILEAKKKPRRMEDDEWEWMHNEDVRAYLCFKLGLDEKLYGTPPTPEEEEEAEEKGKKKGKKSEDGDEGTNVITVSRKKAIDLMVSLGHTSAATWDDDLLIDACENIFNKLEDDEQQAETPPLQKLLDKLKAGYEAGDLKVKLSKKESE